ncbi:unnamed protein product [Dicrocoelium dendriticum]|nr:unnamed protein product [Dicrocoelium dendriticum]
MLRNPVERYLSEWLQMRRGATWHTSLLRCNGKSARSGWFRPCYTVPEFMSNVTSPAYLPRRQTWYNVSLQTFLRCQFNLANNRQTRMLANLTSLGCYSKLAQWLKPSRSPYQLLSTAQRTLCLSAKYNLAGIFRTFGLSDHMVYTQYMLQRALKIVFNFPLTNLSSFVHGNRTHTQDVMHMMSATDLLKVYYANRLDAELYEFAKRLFLLRFTARVIYDMQIHPRFRRPLYTLWIRNNWPALEYNLLLTKTLNTTSSFYFQFNCHLIRIFQRQSKPQ